MTYPPPYEQQPGAQPVPPMPSSSPPTSPYPTYLRPPAPRRRSNGPILAVVIVLAVLLAGGTVTMCLLLGRTEDPGTVATDTTRDPETPRPEQTTPEQTTPENAPTESQGGNGSGAKVVYEVTGEGPVSIVFLKEDGVTPERATETDLPWRKQLTLSEGASLVTVTAIRSGGGDGSIQCRITIDGEEVAKKTASGTFATATCTKLIL